MLFSGVLTKLEVSHDDPVRYTLILGEDKLDLNAYLNHEFTFRFLNEIICQGCQKRTKKSFFQGYCYACFLSSPFTSDCIMRPELCRAHLNEGRDLDWEKEHHLSPHFVYLSKTSGIKVGVTRKSNAITRWIDQGAVEAIAIAETPNRYLAGCIEVFLKQYLSDRTAWQAMLKNVIDDRSLWDVFSEIKPFLMPQFSMYLLSDVSMHLFQYPVLEVPRKVISFSFDRSSFFSGILLGIKGQYLIFDEGMVLNIRKFTGYKVSLDLS